MRIFIGSSTEQVRLVEWITAFIRRDYQGSLEPVPWNERWPGGRFTLESLLRTLDETDAAILFFTAEDRTWYRDKEHFEPRDNLIFEAGLFIAAHGRERTQLMVPSYAAGDPRRDSLRVPSDIAGLTYNSFDWVDAPLEATGLPYTARTVCDGLRALGPRSRLPREVLDLSDHREIEEVRTFVGDWSVMHMEGIARLAERQEAMMIDILAAYRVGEIRRRLDGFRERQNAQLRACFANMWDESLAECYRRKYHDRDVKQLQDALRESIEFLLGKCDIDLQSASIRVLNVANAPKARYDVRLTPQRITYSYYRVDNAIFLVPLDMKRAQNPSPLAWLIVQEMAPRTFERYAQEYDRLLDEAIRVYP